MGLQESGSASCRAYWTGWENQSQKSNNQEAQMNSGCISRTVFSVPGRSWGAVQGHQTETHTLTTVSAEGRPNLVAKRAELRIIWRMGKNCSFYKCLEKETILWFWEWGLSIYDHIFHFILEGKSKGIHTWLDFLVKPFLLVLEPLAAQVEKRPILLKSLPGWARLTAHGDIKIQLPATTSGRSINIEATLLTPQPSWSQIALFQHAAGSSIPFQSIRILDR